jgi:hypothetical protein
MAVKMHHHLTGSLAAVYPDVVTVRFAHAPVIPDFNPFEFHIGKIRKPGPLPDIQP